MARPAMAALPGARVGHWTGPGGKSGVTAIVFDTLSPASVWVAGGAPGTQETELLDPSRLVPGVDAIIFSGGSAFGLAAADGARRFLKERGRGFAAGDFRVPIVPSAVIFDLSVSGGETIPGEREGYAAMDDAERGGPPRMGRVGAGAGATAGKYLGVTRAAPGGVGLWVEQVEGISVGALAVVNSYGAVVDSRTGSIAAGPRDESGAFVDYFNSAPQLPRFGGATTLCAVVTNARLDKAAARHVAVMAHGGVARATRPSHTPYDGDAVFAVSTGDGEMELARVGAYAARAVERAILAAVTSG